MAYNDCLHKTELAFYARAATLAETLGFHRFTGLTAETKALPSIHFTGESSEPQELIPDQANRVVTLAIKVRTNMDDTTGEEHRDSVQQFLDLFYDDDLASELSSANSDFTCLGWEHMGETQGQVDRSYETTARLRLHVIPNDIS